MYQRCPVLVINALLALPGRYGESEQQLSRVFKASEALGGAIIFLDELDALATSRFVGANEVYMCPLCACAYHQRRP